MPQSLPRKGVVNLRGPLGLLRHLWPIGMLESTKSWRHCQPAPKRDLVTARDREHWEAPVYRHLCLYRSFPRCGSRRWRCGRLRARPSL